MSEIFFDEVYQAGYDEKKIVNHRIHFQYTETERSPFQRRWSLHVKTICK